jgi:hydroxymethylbilane synthase
MPCLSEPLLIQVAARSSPLSRVQVAEIFAELVQHHPHVKFETHFMPTVGDRDHSISLRTIGERTDLFTKEIDLAILENRCRIGIHSAKDLPNPLTDGLELLCLTRGLDPSDSLVLRSHETLESLPQNSVIATSSIRREECVKSLRSGLRFIDLRGTIAERLKKLETGEADGIVVAEAALIRLGLTRLNRIRLPGPTVEGQGQLAVIGRSGDQEMKALFACIETE